MTQRCNRKKTHFPLLALLLLIFIVCSILYNENSIQLIHQDSHHVHHDDQEVPINYIQPNLLDRNSEVLDRFSKCNATREYSGFKIGWVDRIVKSGRMRVSSERCDVFSGKWVFDNTSYPLYNESHCPYMSDQLACHKHGRSDLEYQHWRWQPNDCNLKRWNPTEMWEKLRGKRLMFVGDSLNRGQWISMLCLLQSVIPENKRSITPNAHLTIFRAEEYNASVEFLWAPLLVESNSDDPVNHRLDERIIRPDSVLKHSSQWEHADILVFNTYLWWRQGPVKLLWTAEENGVCEELDGLGAMELAMSAWANWVASKVNPLKKRVFFVTMSPTHLWSREWQPGSEGNCYNEKNPIDQEAYWGSGSDLPTMRMVDKVLDKLDSKVTVLNITQLSEYRKDGHPSIYRKFWEPLKPEQLSNPPSYSDCIHWCLPGVPDVSTFNAASALIWLLVMPSAQREVRERHHYSVDCIVAIYVGILLWKMTGFIWPITDASKRRRLEKLEKIQSRLLQAAKDSDLDKVTELLKEVELGSLETHNKGPSKGLWLFACATIFFTLTIVLLAFTWTSYG